jgi:carboxyl-terminal processing protease
MPEFLKKNSKVLYILLVAGFFVFGIYIGINYRAPIDKITGISNIQAPQTVTADFSPFWKVWDIINQKYPGATDITNQQRVYGAISGLMGSLNDPYSEFFNPDDTKLFESDIEGSFGGIGMEIGMKDKVLTVIAPLKDTPAYKAGIKSGDEILKIDQTATDSMGIDTAIRLIRGDKGTTVTLTILRPGENAPRIIPIVRDIINAPTLDSSLRPDGIFVIKLYSFSANSADLFRTALQKFSASGSDKLLLDLRGNPGGYLDSAISMASWFLPGDKTVVTEDYGAGMPSDVFKSKGYNIFSNKLKFVILIDGGSASASEILSGAMKDDKRAILVGTQSYGKGSVQEVVNVTPDTIMKITVAKWLTPNGISISKKGLTPDYVVPIVQADTDAGKDPQMDKAVNLLNNWPGIPTTTTPPTQ